MKKILLILMTYHFSHANTRCELRPVPSSWEYKLVFPDTSIHTDNIKSCAILLQIHEYRRKHGVLSAIIDHKLKAAYINEEVKL